MNKINRLVLAGLMLCSTNSAFSMGKQERKILYTLHELGQNIADVPMITQNIDMFIGVLEMNIQITEAKLAVADQSFKAALWKNAAMLGTTTLTLITIDKVKNYWIDSLNWKTAQSTPVEFIKNFALYTTNAGFFLSRMFAGLNIYDAWKNKVALIESLSLDRQILWQLIEIKDSMDQSAESAENFLLKSAE